MLLTATLLLSVAVQWLQHPLVAKAYYDCIPDCYGKTGWTGQPGTVAGESATIHVPQNITVDYGVIRDAVWIWDDSSYSFVSAGIAAYHGTNNAHFFYGNSLNGGGFVEYPQNDLAPGMFGYNADITVYKDPNDFNNYIVGLLPSCCQGNYYLAYGPFWESRTMIGIDS